MGSTLLLLSCEKTEDNIDYKKEMRDFVIGISGYAKSMHPDFIVIPQNGVELVTANGEGDGSPQADYLSAIDGNGQEDLFYGYDRDDKSTSAKDNQYLMDYLDISKSAGNTMLVTDYCSTHSNMDDSYNRNHLNGYISFSADHRELDNIPDYPDPIFSQNDQQVNHLSQIQNFLYLINPEAYHSKNEFINAVTATNYDLVIMDLFSSDGEEFTGSEIEQLPQKANEGKRLVIAYMSIGEAEDYRFYWQNDWSGNEPVWMEKENPNWKGNFKVRYWMEEWQQIIYGSDNSYLDKILAADFDGVYLDIIDAFEYFE